MYLIGYSLRNLRRSALVYGIFGLLLVLLLSILMVFYRASEDNRESLAALLREYGCAYGMQETYGHLVPREVYESLRALPYVEDIVYRKYTHYIAGGLGSLALAGESLPVEGDIFVVGYPGYGEGTPLLWGRFPESGEECLVVAGSSLESCGPGSQIALEDGFSGVEGRFTVVGMIGSREGEELLGGPPDPEDLLLFTTMEAAAGYASPQQMRALPVPGVVEGYDATVYLKDYRDGETFKAHFSDRAYGERMYTAVNQKEGFAMTLRRMEQLLAMNARYEAIFAAMGLGVSLLFVLVRTGLRGRELCILRSMGLSRGRLVLSALAEYGVFLLGALALGCLASAAYLRLKGLEPKLAQYLARLPLLLGFFLADMALTPIAVLWVSGQSMSKILRSGEQE